MATVHSRSVSDRVKRGPRTLAMGSRLGQRRPNLSAVRSCRLLKAEHTASSWSELISGLIQDRPALMMTHSIATPPGLGRASTFEQGVTNSQT